MNTPKRIDPSSAALIVVDVQNDFCKGGALEVPGADEVIPPLNRLLELTWSWVAATRDWHPPGHGSFKEQGGPWPPHCVQGSDGARFRDALHSRRFDEVISTGVGRDDPGYAGTENPRLLEGLRERDAKQVAVGGLATDYCVRATVLSLLEEGFDVTVLADCVRAVDVNPGDGERALEEMRAHGATVTSSGAIGPGAGSASSGGLA